MEITSKQPTVLRNRAALLFALLFCIYEALPRSITSLRPSSPNERDPILIFGLIASIVITALIAVRSTFLGDRVVFGAAAAAFVLWLLRSLLSLGPSASSVVNVLASLMWAIGAVASLVILLAVLRNLETNLK
jgi:uncharacterized membrane protein